MYYNESMLSTAFTMTQLLTLSRLIAVQDSKGSLAVAEQNKNTWVSIGLMGEELEVLLSGFSDVSIGDIPNKVGRSKIVDF